MARQRKIRPCTILGVILIIAFTVAVYVNRDSLIQLQCAEYSPDVCPEACMICYPCKNCTNLACQPEAVCKSLGYNESLPVNLTNSTQ